MHVCFLLQLENLENSSFFFFLTNDILLYILFDKWSFVFFTKEDALELLQNQFK